MSIHNLPPGTTSLPSTASLLRSPAPTSITIRPDASAGTDKSAATADAGPSFGDLLDVINPLQHIPIISTIYQHLTGDTISPAASIMGGALFGGPLGLLSSIADQITQQATGKGIADNVLSALTGGGATQTASSADTAKVKEAAARTQQQDAALALLNAAHLDNNPLGGQTDDDDDRRYDNYGLHANVPAGHAAAAYHNAQTMVLSVFEPQALAAIPGVGELH